MSADFMSDTGLDPRPELNSEPLFKTEMPDAFGKSAGPFRAGARVLHLKTGRRGHIKFMGTSGGPSIACEWDDGSVGMFSAEDLAPEP